MGDANPNVPARPQDVDGFTYVERPQMPAGSGAQAGAPFHSQFSGLRQQHGADVPRQHPSLAAYGAAPQHAAGGSLNLGSMASALPEYTTSQPAVRGQHAGVSGLRGPQFSSVPPFSGQHNSGQFGGPPFDTTLETATGQQSQRLGHVGGGAPQFSTYAQPMPQYYYHPNAQFSPQAQPQFYAGGAQNVPVYGRRPSFGSGPVVQSDFLGNFPGQGLGRPVAAMGGYGDLFASDAVHQRPPSSSASLGSVPRGPPRKPKQSGHALWVGNLPPTTTVLGLKDHFSRDATKDIESLFLISKSNCAFVNYRTEESCAAAMQRFHDSRFQNVRLVCRLRRSSAAPAGVPSGPAAMTQDAPPSSTKAESTPEHGTTPDGVDSPAQSGGDAPESEAAEQSAREGARDRYFIVKSLTLQDLNLSVRNGIWATQSHNEEALNKAYQSAENVYLVFSANKSGEYFGYARMTSPIAEDAKEVLGTIPRHEPTVEAADALRTIPTPATESAPKGRIIDDSARGTIFWEADHSDEEPEEEPKPSADKEDEGQGGPQTWGKPFKIEWKSTNRLPFYRTRGLRNPWNANREVKIARDGTELEPSVGSRLIQMFHRMGQPPGAQMPQMAMTGMPGLPSPGMRPY